MAEKLGVAILGYGFMGSMHHEAYSWVPECAVKGIWARDATAAREAAGKAGTKIYGSVEEALNDDEVNIIDVCTPTFTHAEYAIASAGAGKNVLVEKAMALSLEEADGMIEAAEKSKVKLMVAHELRFFPEYMKLKELLDRGAIGDPVVARAVRESSMPDWSSWFTDISKSGGVAVDLAIHDIDFLLSCFNRRVTRVYAKIERLVNKSVSAHDFALITLRFEGGTMALVEACWGMPKQFPFTMKLEIDGREGMLQLDNQSPVPVKLYTNTAAQSYSPETLPWKPAVHPFPVDPFVREIRHFAECIIKNRKPQSDGETSKKSLEVCLAARRSAEKGTPVTLPLEAR